MVVWGWECEAKYPCQCLCRSFGDTPLTGWQINWIPTWEPMGMNVFSYNKHNKITRALCLSGPQRSMAYDMRFVSEDNEWSLADCANDLLCSRIISSGSSGEFHRDQDSFVIVLQIVGAFPRNWVKSIVHQCLAILKAWVRLQQIHLLTFTPGLINTKR